MHNGDTIQKLIAVVDTIHERASDNAVKTVFTARLRLGIVTTTEQAIVKRI